LTTPRRPCSGPSRTPCPSPLAAASTGRPPAGRSSLYNTLVPVAFQRASKKRTRQVFFVPKVWLIYVDSPLYHYAQSKLTPLSHINFTQLKNSIQHFSTLPLLSAITKLVDFVCALRTPVRIHSAFRLINMLNWLLRATSLAIPI
jgi:hypothetical protein